ncbi:MAG: hypothetical protein HIU86_14670 [Acidobacteria bacterium]|nr:hypothetical protein [Acidobacteriota bacterium]
MGWIKDAKATQMGKEAQQAWDAGVPVFTPLLNMPATRPDFSGAITDWPLMMAAIQEAGWKLHTWAVGSDSKGRPAAMPLFTR